jgi:hypothetical protein
MMAALPYALSVHHFVSQVGDYVGFAAIVAVAIMVLLLFAHARETAELRRRAEFAEDELALLHEQVEWLHDAQQPGVSPGAVMPGSGTGDVGVAAAPPPASAAARGSRSPGGAGAVAGAAALATGAGIAAATSTGTTGAVAPVPAPASAARGRTVVLGAPVGVGAPALSSATKLIPPTDEELGAVAAAAAAPSTAGTEAGSSAGRGGTVAAPPAPPPATAAAGNGKPPRRPGIAADPGAPAGAGRPAYPAAVTSPRRNYGSGGERSGGRRFSRALIAAITLLVAAIAVVVVLVLDHGSSNKGNNRTTANQTSATAKGKAKAKAKTANRDKARGATVKINPQTVTVAVLNGTTTANLAAAVSDKLSGKGFQQGATGNAANQTMATTIVGYQPSAPGAKNDAYAVAVALGLKPTAVKPVSAASQSVACSGSPTSCPDQVIVTVGADLNSDAA